MGPLAYSLCEALKDEFDIRLVAPDRYPYHHDGVDVRRVASSESKAKRALMLLDLRVHGDFIRAVDEWKPDLIHIFNSEGYPWSVALALWAHSGEDCSADHRA